MIRSTVARVDLAALQSNFRAIQRVLVARGDLARLARSHRTLAGIIAVVKANAYGHGSERVALALEQAGATMLACADIEEGIVLRRAGVRVPILVFGALSVSDLDGLFEFSLTPTISTPSAARAVQAAAAQRADDARLSPQDRHRHEPARVPPRQPAPHAAGAARQREPAARGRLHALRHRGRCRSSPLFDDQRVRFEQALDDVDALAGPAAGRDACVARCGHACNSAALLRDSRVWYDVVRPGLLLYGIVPPPLASTIPLTAGDVADQPRRRGQGAAARRGRRLRLAVQRPDAARRSPSCRPATPTASTCGSRAAGRC